MSTITQNINPNTKFLNSHALAIRSDSLLHIKSLINTLLLILEKFQNNQDYLSQMLSSSLIEGVELLSLRIHTINIEDPSTLTDVKKKIDEVRKILVNTMDASGCLFQDPVLVDGLVIERAFFEEYANRFNLNVIAQTHAFAIEIIRWLGQLPIFLLEESLQDTSQNQLSIPGSTLLGIFPIQAIPVPFYSMSDSQLINLIQQTTQIFHLRIHSFQLESYLKKSNAHHESRLLSITRDIVIYELQSDQETRKVTKKIDTIETNYQNNLAQVNKRFDDLQIQVNEEKHNANKLAQKISELETKNENNLAIIYNLQCQVSQLYSSQQSSGGGGGCNLL